LRKQNGKGILIPPSMDGLKKLRFIEGAMNMQDIQTWMQRGGLWRPEYELEEYDEPPCNIH